MTTISIWTQIPIYALLGENGCILFALFSALHAQLLAMGGFGMAVFRLICVENRVIQFDREKLIKTIHKIQVIILISTTLMSNFGTFNIIGQEKNGMFLFCKDYGIAKVEISHSYFNYGNQEFGKLKQIFL